MKAMRKQRVGLDPNRNFSIVDAALQGEEDRKGNYHARCPWCGKEPARGQNHFSYFAGGGHCFVCGNSANIKELADLVGDGFDNTTVERRQPRARRKTKVAWWKNKADQHQQTFVNHPKRFDLWKAYKPLPDDVIIERGLGVGILPQSECQHPRLIVPMFDGGKIAWFRGRRLHCDCREKWASSGGVTIASLPLYGAEYIQPGADVWIVENMVDSIMLTTYTDKIGVATLSVSYWTERWTQTLLAARPRSIVVAYDNDIPGNGGGVNHDQFAAEWMAEHGTLMQSRGPILVNKLQEAGLSAQLYAWPANTPKKYDIGSFLESQLGQ